MAPNQLAGSFLFRPSIPSVCPAGCLAAGSGRARSGVDLYYVPSRRSPSPRGTHVQQILLKNARIRVVLTPNRSHVCGLKLPPGRKLSAAASPSANSAPGPPSASPPKAGRGDPPHPCCSSSPLSTLSLRGMQAEPRIVPLSRVCQVSRPGGPEKRTAPPRPPQPHPVRTSGRRRQQHQCLRGRHPPPACMTAPRAPVGPHPQSQHSPLRWEKSTIHLTQQAPSNLQAPQPLQRPRPRPRGGLPPPSRYPAAPRWSLTAAGSAAGHSPPQGSQTSRTSDGGAKARNRPREPFYMGSAATGNQDRKNPNHRAQLPALQRPRC